MPFSGWLLVYAICIFFVILVMTVTMHDRKETSGPDFRYATYVWVLAIAFAPITVLWGFVVFVKAMSGYGNLMGMKNRRN